VVLIQSELIEFRGDSDDIICISAELRDRVEQIQVGILFMDKTRNEGRVLVVFRVGLFIDCSFEVVV